MTSLWHVVMAISREGVKRKLGSCMEEMRAVSPHDGRMEVPQHFCLVAQQCVGVAWVAFWWKHLVGQRRADETLVGLPSGLFLGSFLLAGGSEAV